MQNAANIPIILSFEICSDSAGQPGRVCPYTSQAVATPGCSDHSSSEGKSTATMDSKDFNWFKRFNILMHPSSSIYFLISEMLWNDLNMYMYVHVTSMALKWSWQPGCRGTLPWFHSPASRREESEARLGSYCGEFVSWNIIPSSHYIPLSSPRFSSFHLRHLISSMSIYIYNLSGSVFKSLGSELPWVSAASPIPGMPQSSVVRMQPVRYHLTWNRLTGTLLLKHKPQTWSFGHLLHTPDDILLVHVGTIWCVMVMVYLCVPTALHDSACIASKPAPLALTVCWSLLESLCF